MEGKQLTQNELKVDVEKVPVFGHHHVLSVAVLHCGERPKGSFYERRGEVTTERTKTGSE